MKKIFYTMAVAAALFTGYSAYNTQKNNEFTDIALANVEALANPEGEEMKCDNSTYIRNEALRTAYCAPLGLGGTHLKCKSENNCCCDPSKQTDCKGIL